MYQFSSRLKSFSFALMVLGILGIGYGFWSAPKTNEDVEAILKEQEAHHGGTHHDTHSGASHSDASHEEHASAATHNTHEASTHKVESADTQRITADAKQQLDETKVAADILTKSQQLTNHVIESHAKHIDKTHNID